MKLTENIEALNCDCMEYMKDIPDKYFDLAIVDPPYGINVNMNMGRKKGEKKRYLDKKWDSDIPNEKYFKELIRISKNNIIWGGVYFTQFLPPSMGWIVWNKDVPSGMSFSDFEMAWTSFNTAAKQIKIPYCGFIGQDNKKRIHPTQKPVVLYEWILKNYAKPNDKILDTHGGSMSHAIAVDKANVLDKKNLSLVICELDSDYFNDAVKRFENYKLQLNLFP